jgi:16S rRNA (guanine1207-N2)-methyltransferase
MLNAIESRPDRRWMRDVKAPRNAVLQALLHPFAEGALAPAGDTLFMNARADPALPAQAAGWTCVQGFKPWADALAAAGLHSQPSLADDASRHACVLLPLPRQRDLARAHLVEGLRRLAPGGVLVVAQANDAGAKSAIADLARLASPIAIESKYHCRVAWTASGARRIAPALEDEWLQAAAPRAVPGTAWLARPGVFARDRIDAGSLLLAGHLPADVAGAVADLGAGWGFLSATLLQRCPGIRSLDLFEADAQALALAQANLATIAHPAARQFHWHDVRRGLPAGFDAVVSNPPFHVDGADDPQLGRDFIAAAAAALRPGGRFWLVANRHLPYEATLDSGFAEVREVAQRDGFKVIEARAR